MARRKRIGSLGDDGAYCVSALFAVRRSFFEGWREGLDKKTVRMNIRPNGKMISRIILEVRHRMYPTHRVLPVTEKRKGAERLALSLPVIHG